MSRGTRMPRSPESSGFPRGRCDPKCFTRVAVYARCWLTGRSRYDERVAVGFPARCRARRHIAECARTEGRPRGVRRAGHGALRPGARSRHDPDARRPGVVVPARHRRGRGRALLAPAPTSFDAALAPVEGPGLAALVTAPDPPDASVVFTSLVEQR